LLQDVANFSSTEDDTTFWSRLIHPEANTALAPRATRNAKSYAEDYHAEKPMKRRRPSGDVKERPAKRHARASEVVVARAPKIEGAAAPVSVGQGGTLSKKDAIAFVRVVKWPVWKKRNCLSKLEKESKPSTDIPLMHSIRSTILVTQELFVVV
ncbi:hypothetical protein GOP47_0012447, partial [Adiantum capillus-veneris]